MPPTHLGWHRRGHAHLTLVRVRRRSGAYFSRAKSARLQRQKGRGTHSRPPLASSSWASRSRVELDEVKTCEPRGSVGGRRTAGEVHTWEVGGRTVTTWWPEGSHRVKACTVVVIWVLVAMLGCP